MVTKQSKGLWPVIAFLCGLGALVTVGLILYTLLAIFLIQDLSLAWKTWVWGIVIGFPSALLGGQASSVLKKIEKLEREESS